MESDNASENRNVVESGWDAIDRLDEDYRTLSEQEAELQEVLERLKREEGCLKDAIREATESGVERLQEQRQQRQATIVARLEDALMKESDSDGDSDEGGSISVFSVQNSAMTSLAPSKRAQV